LTALQAALLAACGAVSVPEIALDLANPKQATVLVKGLSRADLAALERAQLSPEAWAAVFRVSVAPESGPASAVAVAGRYAVADGTVRFTPMYPLDPGRHYQVVFDPSAATGAGLGHLTRVSNRVSMPAAAPTPPVTVTGVYPTGPAVPSNLLRMYIEFSAPMGSRTGQDYVSIVDGKGAEMHGALLPLDSDLWNGERTRFTILFDPGRVKRGILPNRVMGRPLRPGDAFTLVVRREWPDAHSKPLASEFRKDYRVGPPIERPLSTAHWRVAPPPAGSRDPLRVTFPAALDHGLVQRALSVLRGGAEIAGDIRIENGETEWRFVPRDSWTAGEYAVSVLPVLEDPAGNRIGQAFETLTPDDDNAAKPARLLFTIR
jgi:hypothetical protein